MLGLDTAWAALKPRRKYSYPPGKAAAINTASQFDGPQQFAPQPGCAAQSAHAKVTNSIIVNPFGVPFCRIHGLPDKGINFV